MCEVTWQERMKSANGTDKERREQSQAEKKKTQKNRSTAQFVPISISVASSFQ